MRRLGLERRAWVRVWWLAAWGLAACGSTPTTTSPCGIYPDEVCLYSFSGGCTYDVPICCSTDTRPHCDTGGVLTPRDTAVSCPFTNRMIRCPSP
jgi:hypothetical protein